MAAFALLQLAWRTLKDYLSALVASLLAEVDNPVGTLYNLHIVLYNDNGMSVGYQRVKGFQKTVYIVEMQACGGLVEDKHYLSLLAILRQK